MTFAFIQSKVQDMLNLTSAQSATRIGDSINIGYRQIASSVGIKQNIERVEGVTATTTINVRQLVFGPTPTPVEKILSVYNNAYTPPQVLYEVSVETLRNEAVGSDPPDHYAISAMGVNSVTIDVSSVPASNYVLTADVLSNQSTLSGTMVPAFAEDFHDILLCYPMYIELIKQEKYQMAAEWYTADPAKPSIYQRRLSDLRYYMAVSAYRELIPGTNAQVVVGGANPIA